MGVRCSVCKYIHETYERRWELRVCAEAALLQDVQQRKMSRGTVHTCVAPEIRESRAHRAGSG